MAYVHCHSCDWEQDDFYSVYGYNPARYLLDWMKDLCSDKIDEQFTDDPGFIAENGPITTREVIAREFEKFGDRIRQMKWITEEQWKKDENKVCPGCGSAHLDID